MSPVKRSRTVEYFPLNGNTNNSLNFYLEFLNEFLSSRDTTRAFISYSHNYIRRRQKTVRFFEKEFELSGNKGREKAQRPISKRRKEISLKKKKKARFDKSNEVLVGEHDVYVGCNDALSVTMPRASMRDPPLPRVRSVSCNDVDAATGQIGPFFLIPLRSVFWVKLVNNERLHRFSFVRRKSKWGMKNKAR